MIGFAEIWDTSEIGDEVTVANGSPEPATGPDSLDHKVWRSHNFTGSVAEKIEGDVRAMRIDLPANDAGNVVGFVVCEGDGHSFTPAALSPLQARNLRWEEAKAYHASRAAGGFVLPGVGVIQTNADSREAIRTLADEAKDKIAGGELDWSTSFKNEANVRVPVTALQIIGVYAALRAFLGACYDAKEDIGDALNAALAEGATAADILAIDITAGYPG